ncbi:MAG: major capsid protein [Microviridae sp.]|nr:MAG: major capsid protein [Microviridae sp.]
MKNLFNSVKMTRPPQNRFDLSHDVKLSCEMGNLVPTCVMEAIPGDRFNIGCDSLLRFAPLVAPVMHRMDVSMHYFFVPNRILWDGWEDYITNTEVGGSLPAVPFLNTTGEGATYSKLMNYMGVPPQTAGYANNEKVSAFAFAAYQMIYNEYYRDQNLQAEIDFKLVDGDNGANAALIEMRRRAWEHDYFTACLPFAQKGDPVTIPIAGFEDVAVKVDNSNGNTASWTTNLSGGGTQPAVMPQENTDIFPANSDRLYADTSSLDAQAATINDLRRAFRLQEWLEKQARGGSRYTENILAHFGVKSSDARLQRPEYITGTKSPVIISEVLNTTGTDDSPQGNMAGHGISVTQGKYGSYMCEEHGYVIGIMSVMPKTAYQQGIPKHFLKFTDPFQYYWPAFANIGEQEVDNSEVFAYNAPGTFGYVPRYAEYKFMNNRVAGDFQTTLDFWHLGRIFSAPPALNGDFISCDPGKRIFAVTDPDIDSIWAHVLHKISAVRSMPKFGTPTT